MSGVTGGPGEASAVTPVLVYLYGPPAAGKLTIAEKVRDLTGFRLFHNHLTINAVREVFDFGTRPFADVIHRIRLDVFETAMRANVNLIFTNNSLWGPPDADERFRAFSTHAADVVRGAGGVAVFVRVTASLEVLETRVADESRRSHGKLLDPARLRQLFGDRVDPQIGPTDLVIDTGECSPDDAARLVAAAARAAGRGTGSDASCR
jgi:chloramphenicol 3-O-phosphotransferase